MIIFYLKMHTKTTIDELSEYLEVSRRTVCRDIEILRTSGVDIISCPGKDGGYRLSEDFSFEKMIFSKCELTSMLLSTKLLQQFKGTEFAKEAEALNCKIEKLLEKNNKSASKMSEFLLVDTEPEQRQNNIQEILSCVEKAYDNNMLLFIEYRSPFCKKLSTSGFVAPYGLVNKAGYWYIVGFCYEFETYRTFNTIFINKIYMTEKPFTKNKDFNLDKYWEAQKSK